MATLTSEDYENIWLRTKDRFLKWYLWVLLFFSVLSGILGFSIAKTLIGPEVARYVESDAFKERVSSHLFDRLPRLESRVGIAQANIDDLLQAISAIEGRPFQIEPGIISLLGEAGSRIIIQYGRMSAAMPVTFAVRYTEEPIVVVTNVGGVSAQSSTALFNVTAERFSVPPSPSNHSINWLAVGR